MIDGIDPHEYEPVDNCLQSVLSWDPKFSDRFCRTYSKWIDEVFSQKIDWDILLTNTRGIAFEQQF